jgi:hypothetical protein
MYMLGLIKGGPATDVIAIEDRALLNDIIEVWCNMIEPDQFAAVMSALRDCEDDRRRESIMDDMKVSPAGGRLVVRNPRASGGGKLSAGCLRNSYRLLVQTPDF